MPDESSTRFTARLRLEPVGPANARDLWLVHSDDEVAHWYDGAESPGGRRAGQVHGRLVAAPRRPQVDRLRPRAARSSAAAGLSPPPVDDDWGQIYPLSRPERWVREAHEMRAVQGACALAGDRVGAAAKFWGSRLRVEIGGWSRVRLRRPGMQAVVSCTVRHNVRSRGDGAHRHAVRRARSAAAARLRGLMRSGTARRSRCASLLRRG